MARVNDVTIRLLADVTKLKTGFSSAGQSVKQLSSQIQGLTNGQIKLTAAGRFYDNQKKQFISTARAEAAISKGLQREYTRTQTAVTAVSNATKAAVQAEMQKVNASKSLAQISKETIAMYSASGNAVQHLTARLVALTKGQYLLTASGKILNATTKEEVTVKQVATAATDRLAMEQQQLRAAYDSATQGMDAQQKRLLDTQMAMTGLSSITGSASFAAISMGQIFQDMGQFGMGAAQGVRAITNNVQQTVQSLVMLSAVTAKGESVFKAFTTALTGPVGFLVAFSFVTGAIEFFSNRMQKAQKDAEDLSKKLEGLFKIINDQGGAAVESFTVRIPESQIERVLEDERKKLQLLNDDILKIRREAAVARRSLSKSEEDELAVLIKLRSERQSTILALEEQIKEIELTRRAQELANQVAKDSSVAKKNEEIGIRLATEARKAEHMQLQGYADAMDTVKRRVRQVFQSLTGFSFIPPVLQDVGLALGELDVPDEVSTFASNFADEVREAKDNVQQLKTNLALLKTDEGVRLALLDAQTKELEKQIQRQLFLNKIRAGLLPDPDVIDDSSRIPFLGPDTTSPELPDIRERALTLQEQQSERNSKFVKETEENAKKLEEANNKLALSYDKLGADLISSVASIGGGFDQFNRTFGRFLSRWGKQLVQMGLAEMGFGKALVALRESIKTPFGGFAAVAAGAALVAIGKRLSAATRAASTAGTSSSGFAGGGITRASFSTFQPFQNREQFMAGGLGAQFAPARQPTIPYEFRLRGRDLVAAVDETRNANTRRGIG